MTTQASLGDTHVAPAQSTSFDRFAGLCAILTGIASFLYAVSFIILHNGLLSSLFLMLVGLFYTPALAVLYSRLRQASTAFPLWAFLLSSIGAFGAAIHGGYDLANAINPPTDYATIASLPSAIDPRGLLTFGIAGLGLFTISWLIGHSTQFPKALSYLGYLGAVLLIILYIGRLIILLPTNPLIAYPALMSGFLVSPIWYVWLGFVLWRGRSQA